MKMKGVLSVLLVLFPAEALVAEEKPEATANGPTVEVYEIRRTGEGAVLGPKTILEIANPTDRTFYFRGGSISSPNKALEVKRGEKWLVGTLPSCPVGDEIYAFRPGAKMLLSVCPTWTEEACRFRFFFCTGKDMSGEVVSARTRTIKPEELGERGDTYEMCEKKRELEEPRTDEELNKARRAAEEAKKK